MNSSPDTAPQRPRRGAYLLPNLFTTGALFAGFYAITSAIHGRFELAAIAIFIAMIMDGLDGRIARMTNTQSAFGAEYDSLSDMVCFGAAPALVMFQWSLHSLGKLGWSIAFIYMAFAGLRLARFNVQAATAHKAYFQGLPSPAAAAVVAGMVWVGVDQEWSGETLRIISLVITLCAAVLMVSNIRYRSFKDLNLRERIPLVKILPVVLLFVLVFIHPALVLFGIFLAYAVSGPVLTLLELRRRRLARRRGIPPVSGT